MHVHLLREAGGPLEGRRERPPVDQEVARHDAEVGALGERVEQRGLAGAGSAHQRGQLAGFHVALDGLEELALAFFVGDGVVDVLPGD